MTRTQSANAYATSARCRAARWFSRILVLAVLPLTAACGSGTGYQPARSPRVTVTSSLLWTSYTRDGRTFGGGPFSQDLEEAVSGNQRAEGEARVAQRFSVAGFVVELAGIGAMGTGVGLAATHDAELRETGTWLALGGAAALLTGMIITANANARANDAVGIYNDAVDTRAEQAAQCAVVAPEGTSRAHSSGRADSAPAGEPPAPSAAESR